MISGKFTREETNQKMYERVLKEYLKRIQENGSKVDYVQWAHIGKLLDSREIEHLFREDFDFHEYYESYNPQSN